MLIAVQKNVQPMPKFTATLNGKLWTLCLWKGNNQYKWVYHRIRFERLLFAGISPLHMAAQNVETTN